MTGLNPARLSFAGFHVDFIEIKEFNRPNGISGHRTKGHENTF
jgi:hypothetical protein